MNKVRVIIFAMVSATAGCVSLTVQAGESTSDVPNQSANLQEIIVTAEKREERLQDVPISLVVLNAVQLARQNIASVDDLALVVPGLSIEDTGITRYISLRGISNFSGAGASLIGAYVDEADITAGAVRQLGVDIYDIQRVEV